MMMAIFGNSITLASYDYSDPDDQHTRNKILSVADTVFTGFYTVEAILKILAYGFFVHRKSYLRDPWNVLDFVSLTVSYISLLPGVPNFKPLRILRVMKPLRSVNSMPTMKKLFNTLIMSLPHIGQVVLFMLFVFGIFAILGNQLFKNDLYKRCRLTPKPIPAINNKSEAYWPLDQTQQRLCGGIYTCKQGTYCGAPLDQDLPLSSDNLTSDPLISYGFLHFDDVGIGILSIFRVVTLEGWSFFMYNYMDSMGVLSSLYFPLIVLLGSFFLLNLFLAVIMETFSEMTEIQKQIEKAKNEAKMRKMRKIMGKKTSQEELLERQETNKNKMIQRMISVNEKKNELNGGKIMNFADIAILMLAHKNQLKKKKEAEEQNGPQSLINLNDITEDSMFEEDQQQDVEYKDEDKSNSNDPSADAQKSSDANNKPDQSNDGSSNIPQFSDTCFEKTREFMYSMCMTTLFQSVITLSILLNTGCLALDGYPPNLQLQAKLDIANIIFFVVFLLEMLIKVIGMGPRVYVKDQFNIFDAFVVLISIVDLIINYSVTTSGGGASAISALRAFRLMRIFKLAKSWTQLQNLLRTIAQSLKDISSFSVLILLLIFIYTLIGLELFSHQIHFSKDETQVLTIGGYSPRNNFDDFYHSFLVIFQVLLSDNWDEVMFSIARVKGPIAIFFFVSLIVIGVMFFLNIFLAILLENFGVDNEIISKQADAPVVIVQNMEQVGITEKAKQFLKGLVTPVLPTPKTPKMIQFGGKSATKDPLMLDSQIFNDPSRGIEITTPRKDNLEVHMDIKNTPKTSRNEMTKSMIEFEESLMLPAPQSSRVADTPKASEQNNLLILRVPENHKEGKKSLAVLLMEKKQEQRKYEENQMTRAKTLVVLEGRSLGIFSSDSKIRNQIANFVSNPIFDGFIILLISLSSIMIALDNPLNDPNGVLSNFLYYIDIIFTSIFSIESILKILAFGLFFNGESSYMKNSWNMMDCVIVVLSILSISLNSVQGLSIIKIFRLLRVLRPLRLIRRVKMLKIAIQALFKAIPSIFNVVVVSLLFFIIFGIIGINYFKGTFFSCQLPNISKYPVNLKATFDTTVDTKNDCLNIGGDWMNADANFDHMPIAINTLFQISSTEGWAAIMFNGMDSVGVDLQPKRENSLYWSLFFIIFVVFGDFFIMNLFAGAVVMTFNKEKEVLGKSHLLNDKQKKWIEQKRGCLSIQPLTIHLAHDSKYREFCRMIILSHSFNYIIFGVILLNTLSLAISWYNQPLSVTYTTMGLNYFFSSIFIVEVMLKLVGLGVKPYFKDSWNRFDFIIVVVTILAEIISQAGGSQIGSAVNFVRAIRVQRMLRYIKKAKRIRVIFQTFIVTLPSLSSVGGLLLLCLYMYSILGVFLFAGIKLQNDLSIYANFQTFWYALLTLWRCATGEGWNSIMFDAMRQRSILFQCDDSGNFDYQQYIKGGSQSMMCGSQTAGVIFFISFYLIVPHIFLNLFIAIILEGFTTTNNSMSSLIQEDDLENFIECWAKFDQSGSGLLRIKDFPEFLFKLGSPLGWDPKKFENNQKAQDDFLEELHIPTYNGFQSVQFWDVIQALAKMYMVRVEIRKVIKSEIEELHEKGTLDFQLDDDTAIIKIIEERMTEGNQEHRVMKMQLRLELEFEALDMQMRECLDVEIIRIAEDNIMRAYNQGRDHEYTSAHIKAGRRIMQALKRLVQAKKRGEPVPKNEAEMARMRSEEKVKAVENVKRAMAKNIVKQVSPYQQIKKSRQPPTLDFLSSAGQNSQQQSLQLKETWSPKGNQDRHIDAGMMDLSEIVKDEENRLAENIIITFDKRQHW